MKKLIIELPDYVHRSLKNRCFKNEITMREYITELLLNDLKLKEREKK